MLTTSQKKCLEKLKEYQALSLYRGGYWSRDSLLIPDNGKADQFEFYFSSVTINALINKGLVDIVKTGGPVGQESPIMVKLKD